MIGDCSFSMTSCKQRSTHNRDSFYSIRSANLGGDWVDFKMEHLQGEDGQLTMTDAEGIERIVAYLHIPKVNWTLFCSMPSASLDEAIAHRLEDAFQQIADGHYGSKIAPPLPTQ